MKNLESKKRIASNILKCSEKKVIFNQERLAEIKEAITKQDLRALIADKAIVKKQDTGVSRARAKKRQVQRSKGRQKGHGTRKGRKNARQPSKQEWVKKIRLQRNFIKELKDKEMLTAETFKDLYRKSKGGFFRNKRHLKTYITEQKLVVKNEK